MAHVKSWMRCGVFLGIPLMLGCPVRNLTINPGFAFFEVQQASGAKDVTGPRQVVIEATIIEVSRTELPVDFFDPNSDALDATIPFVGQPLETSPLVNGNLDRTDTLMAILQQVNLSEIGSQATVQAKIAQMSLMSIDPITVTYNSGQDPELWDVGLTIDFTVQMPGALNVTRTGTDSGTAEGQLPVITELSFVRRADGKEVPLEKSGILDLSQFNWSTNPVELNWPQNGRTNMVPGLSKIPVIGNLFEREQVEMRETELLIFITPTIVRDVQ